MQNSANNKRIAKNTIILYFRMFFMMGISLYTSRVVLDILGVDDYGIYNVVGGVVAMFSFLSGTMSFTTQRFLTFSLGEKDAEKTHKIFCTSINLHIIISIIIFILAETIGLWFLNTQMTISADRIVASNWVYQLSILSTIILFVSMPYNGVIIAHEKMSAFAYISIFEAVLRLALVYLLLVFDYDKLILYAVLMLFIQLLLRIIYGVYCKRNFSECSYNFLLDKQIFRQMLGFTSWSFLGGLSTVGSGQGLNILLNMFFTPAINAARAISVQVQASIQTFINNFLIAVRPQIIKSYASKDYERMHSLVLSSGRYSYYLTLLLVFPLILEIEPLLSIWLKEVPNYTVDFVRWILCISLFESLASPIMFAANATGKIARYQVTIASIQLLILPVVYMALKLGGSPNIVYICQFVFTIVAQIFRVWIVDKLVNYSIKKYINSVVIPITLVTILSSIIPLYLYFNYKDDTIENFMLICTATVLSILISIWVVGINKVEKKFVINKITNILTDIKFRSYE